MLTKHNSESLCEEFEQWSYQKIDVLALFTTPSLTDKNLHDQTKVVNAYYCSFHHYNLYYTSSHAD